MPTRFLLSCIFLFSLHILISQESDQNLRSVSIDKNNDYSGFELLDIKDQQLFVLAEHWHNIQSVPRATMKILEYLHENGNVRILAIEQGASSAHLINEYLQTGDTTLLFQIARHTMFWGKENRQFFWDLRQFNLTQPTSERITVRSIDIEYKMASAIYVINELIGDKEIPNNLKGTLGRFKRIYDQTKAHRESYDGLAVMFYFDKELIQNILDETLVDLDENDDKYMDFFADDFVQFAQMILDMDDGLTFDYTNPNTKYKFRDRLIYQKFEELFEENPDKGVLCVIGSRHATKPSSIYKLQNSPSSPIEGQVMNIRISALFHKSFMSNDLRRINYIYPDRLKTDASTLIRHSNDDPTFKSKESFDYTFFLNKNGNLTPFPNVYEGEY